jgi:phage-related protein
MSFWGKTFIFDSIPSERYSLIITSGDGESSITNASGNTELITQPVFRRSVPYLLGVKQFPPLLIQASITTTDNEITIEDSRLIQKWLFGHLEYKKLQIVQSDMPDYYINCLLTSPQIRRVGNIIRGFDFAIQCDSSFGGWANTITETVEKTNPAYNVTWSGVDSLLYTYTETSQNHTVYNVSDNPDYTYPIIKVHMQNDFSKTFTQSSVDKTFSFPGWIKIVNNTDGGRIFYFGEDLGTSPIEKTDTSYTINPNISLLPLEVLEVDNDLQIITSTENYNRLSIMGKTSNDKKFFRLLPKKNELTITGNFKKIEFIYNPMIRIA